MMFRAEKEKNQITVTDGEYPSSMTVAPGMGGMLTSFRVKGEEVFHYDEKLAGRDICAGGFPVLFPICGSLKDDRYAVDGRTLFMPGHGFARNYPWKVLQTEEGVAGGVILELSDDDESRKIYPFPFRFQIKYQLNGNELKVSTRVTNCGNHEMPFYIGYHPFFRVKNKKALRFGIDADSYFDYNEGKTKEYRGSVDFERPVDFIFNLRPSKEYRYEMEDVSDGKRISFRASEDYKHMVMWTEEGSGFLCVEPWMGTFNSLNTGEGVKRLGPEKSAESWVKITASVG